MSILISPYAARKNNLDNNAKDYPWWDEVIVELKRKTDSEIIQIGSSKDKILDNIDNIVFDKSFLELCTLIKESELWISVDTYFAHIASYVKKTGIVIWSKSDPKIFGDPNNINLLKDEKYLRKNQFDFWENEKVDLEAFVSPEKVIKECLKLYYN